MSQTIEPEKFLEVFMSQFEEKARKNVSLNSSFKHIDGWSSLQALMVTVAINEQWNLSFSDEDFRNSTTIQDLFIIIKQKL